jgi:hypothetical protein
MIVTAKLFLLFSLTCIVSSCNDQVGNYFKRPKIIETISNEGTGYRDGELVNTTNMICITPQERIILEDYWTDKESRLYTCIKYPSRCK